MTTTADAERTRAFSVLYSGAVADILDELDPRYRQMDMLDGIGLRRGDRPRATRPGPRIGRADEPYRPGQRRHRRGHCRRRARHPEIMRMGFPCFRRFHSPRGASVREREDIVRKALDEGASIRDLFEQYRVF